MEKTWLQNMITRCNEKKKKGRDPGVHGILRLQWQLWVDKAKQKTIPNVVVIIMTLKESWLSVSLCNAQPFLTTNRSYFSLDCQLLWLDLTNRMWHKRCVEIQEPWPLWSYEVSIPILSAYSCHEGMWTTHLNDKGHLRLLIQTSYKWVRFFSQLSDLMDQKMDTWACPQDWQKSNNPTQIPDRLTVTTTLNHSLEWFVTHQQKTSGELKGKSN